MQPQAIEPIDREWEAGSSGLVDEPSPFPRINEWRKKFQKVTPEICPERALLWTESYAQTEGEPQEVRMAKALAHSLKNMSIWIGDEELLVGNQASNPRAAPVFPEISYDWFLDEMEEFPFEKRPGDRFLIDEETKEKLRGIGDFWKGKTVHERIKGMMPEDALMAEVSYGAGVFLAVNYFFTGVGHIQANFREVFAKGFLGIKAEAEEGLEKLDLSDPENIPKRSFYQSIIITCDAVIDFAKRYADLAREMAGEEEDPQRQEELEQIAENCDRIPANPPRNFWEALQVWWFVQLIIQIESSGHSISPGRFDQYMYPFYERDIEEGAITREFAQELIEVAWMKLNEINKIRDWGSTKAFGGYPMFQNLILGGQDRQGRDATNELSYMCLDATAHVRLPQPSLSVRIWDETPEDFWTKISKVNKIGLGMPAMYNDGVIIPAMLNRGRSLEDARDYTIIGCVEPDVPGWEYGWHDAAFFNMNYVLELAINDGYCTNCSEDCPIWADCAGAGDRLGLPTGTLADFQSLDEVKEAYEKQMEHFVRLLAITDNSIDIGHDELKPLPFLSCVIKPCVERGLGVTSGGAKYNFIGPQGVGVANVADGLSAINHLVFENGQMSGAELLEALESDWEGYEDLHALINSEQIPHYGNDDPFVDDLAHYGALVYCKEVEKYRNHHGGMFQPGLYPVSANLPAGAMQGTTPDGRKAGEAVADGVSPVHGHDVRGPTAVVKSAAKLDHEIASNGTLLNQLFHPSALEGTTGDQNFEAMMKVFFDNKGLHDQHNVVGVDMLKDAQKHPEKYSGLVVRVAGYSVFFTTLDPDLQNDIIGRTEGRF